MSTIKYISPDDLLYYHAGLKNLFATITAVNGKQDALTFDNAPTQNSNNPVKSGGVYQAIIDAIDALDSGVASVNGKSGVVTLTSADIPYSDSNDNSILDSLNELYTGKQDTLTFDSEPTQLSGNPVTSNGLYNAFAGKQDTLTFDNAPTQNSNNPVKSSGIYTALAGKQASLTFDSTPTQNSSNPVTSGGVYAAINALTSIKFEIVQSLPATGVNGTFYLVSNSGSGTNVYDEYVYVNSAWEKIGTTAVDLSNYVQYTDLVAATNVEIDTILAS